MNVGRNAGCTDRLAPILGVAVNSNIYKLASMEVQVDVHVRCGRVVGLVLQCVRARQFVCVCVGGG